MPEFLVYYLVGLTLALGVGMLLYWLVGGESVALFNALFGQKTGRLWGRTFRLALVIMAAVGGLTSKWYGCSYHDYSDVANDRRLMLAKTTEQLSGSLWYATWFLVFAVIAASLVFAVLQPRGAAEPQGSDQPPPPQ